jgi:hypothetical protein
MVKTNKSKSIIHKKYKPEEIIKATSRSKNKPKKQSNKPKIVKSKKRSKNFINFKKISRIKVNKFTIIFIFAVCLLVCVLVVWLYVAKAIKQTNQLYDSSIKIANNMYIVAKKEADLSRVIGTKDVRRSEIINLQSASNSLQRYIEYDYRNFKQSCMVNNKLPDNVGYEIVNVVYDSYALVRKNCQGSENEILKKFDKNWSVVFTGNILPQCSMVNDLAIPQGIMMYCEQNSATYLNPNP